jgi:hypothetical protein
MVGNYSDLLKSARILVTALTQCLYVYTEYQEFQNKIDVRFAYYVGTEAVLRHTLYFEGLL